MSRKKPSLPLDVEAFKLVTRSTSDLADYTHIEVPGFELELLASSTAGVELSVGFGEKADHLRLVPGARVRIDEGFTRIYVKSVGQSGTARLLVTRIAEAKADRRDVFVRTPYLEPLNTAGPEGTWYTDSVAAPAAAQVIRDTGALSAGVYELRAQVKAANPASATSANWLEIQHRNAANSASLNIYYSSLYHYSYVESTDAGRLGPIRVAEGERFRIITNAGAVNFAGVTIWTSLYYRKVGS